MLLTRSIFTTLGSQRSAADHTVNYSGSWDSTKSDCLTKTLLRCPHTSNFPSESWAGRSSRPRAPARAAAAAWPLTPTPQPMPWPGLASSLTLRPLGGVPGPRAAEAWRAELGPVARSYLRHISVPLHGVQPFLLTRDRHSGRQGASSSRRRNK